MARTLWQWCSVALVVFLLVLVLYIRTPATPPPVHASASASMSKSDITPKKLLCYYSVPRPGHTSPPPLHPSDLDPSLCTHIIISSAALHNTTIAPHTPSDLQVYRQVISLRKKQASLQVLLRVEGDWLSLTRDPQALAVFAYNAGVFLRAEGFGGLEVDWQPTFWPSWTETAKHLSLLLLQLNNALKLASHPPLLLTAVVSPTKFIIDRAYDISTIEETVDFVSVATYDFHTFHSYLPFTGHGAPLRAGRVEQGYWATRNMQWAAEYWLQKGLSREKLIVTFPTYGNTWKLLSSLWTHLRAPAVGPGMMGGNLTRFQACVFLQEGAERHWDEVHRVPYAWRSRDWVSYEDEASVKEKAQFVVAEKLAGAAILDLNSDDWPSLCSGAEIFQLTKAAREVLCGPAGCY